MHKKTGMKKITLSIAFSVVTMSIFAQKTIIVNGGAFNGVENVSISVYDTQSNSSSTIDSIGSQSVQDILFDGSSAFVAAQDSLVKYNLNTEKRAAATKFNGASIKTMAIAANNELIVSNWHSRSSFNVYIYNKNTLAVIDSIDVKLGVKSMIIDGDNLYVNQNIGTGAPNWQDTSGYILRASISNRTVLDTIRIGGYFGDIGEFMRNPNGKGFFTINSASNSISTIEFPTATSLPFTTKSFNQNFNVGSQSQLSIHNDTAFLKMNQGLGSIDLNTLTVIDSLIIDTLVTGFTYDTLNHMFYITQSNFSGFSAGKIYDRSGAKTGTFATAASPEVIRMYYDQSTGIFKFTEERNSIFKLYPNPAKEYIFIDLKSNQYEDGVLSIMNMKGQMLKELTNIKEINKLDVSDLPKGLYLIRLNIGSSLYTEKLIIE